MRLSLLCSEFGSDGDGNCHGISSVLRPGMVPESRLVSGLGNRSGLCGSELRPGHKLCTFELTGVGKETEAHSSSDQPEITLTFLVLATL
jgi:hypothetical protein